MRRLSSRLTFYHKRVLPVFIFGLLPVIFIATILGGPPGQAGSPTLIVFFVVIMALSYFMMRMFVFDLLDEVWDGGDELVLHKGGAECRINLADIENVRSSIFLNPRRVTLSLSKTCIFGDNVAFSPPISFLPLIPSPVVGELIDRIDAARRQARRSGVQRH